MIGFRSGALEVIEFSHTDEKRIRWWKCRCDCGNTSTHKEHRLRYGENKSCGCKILFITKPSKDDLICKRFGHLTVVEYFARVKSRPHWKCKCDCGEVTIKSEKGLKNGDTISCGCKNGIKRVTQEKRKIPTKYQYFLLALYRRYKRDADKRGYTFNISIVDMEEVIHKNCEYCGSPPTNSWKGFLYSGIDRVDSDIGYEKYNITPCCIRCNKAKSDLPKNSFFDKVKKIWENLST